MVTIHAFHLRIPFSPNSIQKLSPSQTILFEMSVLTCTRTPSFMYCSRNRQFPLSLSVLSDIRIVLSKSSLEIEQSTLNCLSYPTSDAPSQPTHFPLPHLNPKHKLFFLSSPLLLSTHFYTQYTHKLQLTRFTLNPDRYTTPITKLSGNVLFFVINFGLLTPSSMVFLQLFTR